MRRLCIVLALVFSASCNDNDSNNDNGADQTDGGGGADGDVDPNATFTSFVLDVIANRTSDTADPVPFADFESLPETDADNDGAFASLFQ